MSTMVDNRWDPILQNQQGPITSGYVSNSDIRQRERKDQIKWERQREYEDLMNKKKDTENKRREELYRNSQQNYRPPPEPEMYDHGQIAKDLREERQKEYNDYLEPPSKGFTHHEDRKKMLSQERNNEYNEFLEKKREQEIHTRRQMPPTPPGGLNIATEQERKRVEDIKKTMYRDELLKQQKEQLYNRATQQGEVSVINRTSPTQAPPNQISPRGRPPPHPDSGRRRGPPPQNDRMQPMESHRPQDGDLRTGFFDDRRVSPLNRDERQHDYQQFLANKQREDEMKHQRLEDQRHAPHLDLSKGDYYDAETYERKRMSLNSERKNDYQNFLSKQKENKMSKVKETEDFQTERRHVLAEERNREYNEFLEQTSRPSYRQYTPESLQGLPIGQTRYDHQKKQQEVQRNREYNEHLAKKGEKIGMEDELLTRRDMTLKKYMEDQVRSEMHDKFRDFTKPSEKDVGPDKFGLPIGQFRYDDWRKHQIVERSKEYQDMQAQVSDLLLWQHYRLDFWYWITINDIFGTGYPFNNFGT
ncbi:Hypothetical predicted protein [Mytilus galloprovincialis]|uniref:Uncharacterized protein n=1 Tax=Mytilus galloprovincialis TaxID=29158 RepID=A0A8B6DEB7_MYTGA|nr:Hypothetical predicted protein [Mytilus galloprovincialis]